MLRYTGTTVPAQVSRDWGSREWMPAHYLLPNNLNALCTGWGCGGYNWELGWSWPMRCGVWFQKTLFWGEARVKNYQRVEQCIIEKGLSREATRRYLARWVTGFGRVGGVKYWSVLWGVEMRHVLGSILLFGICPADIPYSIVCKKTENQADISQRTIMHVLIKNNIQHIVKWENKYSIYFCNFCLKRNRWRW